MVAPPSSFAFTAAVVLGFAASVNASPLTSDPYTPVKINVPLTASHPAYGAKLEDAIVQPIIPKDPNVALAGEVKMVPAKRQLRDMEDSAGSDIKDLEKYFGSSMEKNFDTLKAQYASASAPVAPWPSSYWPMFQDSINHVWKSGDASPSEKYAKAYGLDPTDFKNKVSARTGIDSQTSNLRCSTHDDCKTLKDGSVCAKRAGASTGRCIPTWFGICHAWSPAAILEQEPQCDVVKNNVTFHVFDIKALLTYIYDGAEVETVFAGARFDGPDSPAETDRFGRYTDAARRDLGAGLFHIAMTNIMGKQKKSFVVDVNSDSEVWNQPVRSYDVKEMEIVDADEASRNYFGAESYPFNSKMVRLAYVKTTFSWIGESAKDGPLVSSGDVDKFTVTRNYEYLLELDANNNIIGGEWVGRSKEDHPDFLWFPTSKPAASAITDTGLSYADVLELLELSKSCEE